MGFGSCSINYSINSSCYTIRLHNMSGGECCSGREGDVQHHGDNFTLLRCLWRDSIHDEESGIFNSSKKHRGAMGGAFLIQGLPAHQMLTPCFTPWEWESLKHRLPVFVGVMWSFGSQRCFQGLCLYPSGGGGGGEGPGTVWGEGWFCREMAAGMRKRKSFDYVLRRQKRQVGRSLDIKACWEEIGTGQRRTMTQTWRSQSRQWSKMDPDLGLRRTVKKSLCTAKPGARPASCVRPPSKGEYNFLK